MDVVCTLSGLVRVERLVEVVEVVLVVVRLRVKVRPVGDALREYSGEYGAEGR